MFSQHGVTAAGFSRPKIDEIRQYWLTEAEQRFGRTLTGPSSAELQFVEMLSLASDTFWETLQQLYYAGYFPYAEDLQLDNVLALAGVGRLPRREATGEVTFFTADPTGATQPITIPRRTQVSTATVESEQSIPFITTEPAVINIGEDRVERVGVRALGPLETGPEFTAADLGSQTNVAAGSITDLDTPIGGVGGDPPVTNPLPTGGSGEMLLEDDSTVSYDFVTGRDRESDYQYRARYENSMAITGKATLRAIQSNIRNAGDGTIVRSVSVDEQLPIIDNGDGTFSGRHVEPVVLLENDSVANRESVAQAILDSRSAGIESIGDVNVAGQRSDGSAYATGLGFSLATRVPIYIDAEIVTLEDFPSDGVQRIKTNILAYIGGVTPGGADLNGSDIGHDVYRSRVAGCIADNNIPGIREIVGQVNIGTSSPPATTDQIVIADNEVARTDFSDVTITTTEGSIE